MVVNNCAQGGIEVFVPSSDQPWDRQRIQHLLKRLNFGGSPLEIESASQATPEGLVDYLIDQAINAPLPDPPEWANWDVSDYPEDPFPLIYEQAFAYLSQWIGTMVELGFREKMALFWHNLFVTRFQAYECPSYQHQYHTLLQKHALGNFKTLVYEMGKTPAMLVFLNGAQNTKFSPNENYARELYELFTLGRDIGYTQTDITETARALTGFVGWEVFCGPINFVGDYFDDGEKTIFGQKGNWGYDDVHRILFEQKQDLIAQHLSKKLYQNLVHPQIDQQIVDQMAQTMINNDFEMAPVLRQLFKSAHFFDEYNIGATIKSPIELLLGFIKDTGMEFNDEEFRNNAMYIAANLGQELFNPPDVAGWSGDRSWINSNTITLRWQALEYYAWYFFDKQKDKLIDLAKRLSENSNDVAVVTKALVDHFVTKGLPENTDYDKATQAFKIEIPQNYFDNKQWNLDWDTVPVQVAFLLNHLGHLPAYQLS